MADGSDMKSLAAELGLNYFALQYGQHTLQQVGIWEFTDTDNKSVDDSKQSTPGYWLVYVFIDPTPCFIEVDSMAAISMEAPGAIRAIPIKTSGLPLNTSYRKQSQVWVSEAS